MPASHSIQEPNYQYNRPEGRSTSIERGFSKKASIGLDEPEGFSRGSYHSDKNNTEEQAFKFASTRVCSFGLEGLRQDSLYPCPAADSNSMNQENSIFQIIAGQYEQYDNFGTGGGMEIAHMGGNGSRMNQGKTKRTISFGSYNSGSSSYSSSNSSGESEPSLDSMERQKQAVKDSMDMMQDNESDNCAKEKEKAMRAISFGSDSSGSSSYSSSSSGSGESEISLDSMERQKQAVKDSMDMMQGNESDNCAKEKEKASRAISFGSDSSGSSSYSSSSSSDESELSLDSMERQKQAVKDSMDMMQNGQASFSSSGGIHVCVSHYQAPVSSLQRAKEAAACAFIDGYGHDDDDSESSGESLDSQGVIKAALQKMDADCFNDEYRDSENDSSKKKSKKKRRKKKKKKRRGKRNKKNEEEKEEEDDDDEDDDDTNDPKKRQRKVKGKFQPGAYQMGIGQKARRVESGVLTPLAENYFTPANLSSDDSDDDNDEDEYFESKILRKIPESKEEFDASTEFAAVIEKEEAKKRLPWWRRHRHIFWGGCIMLMIIVGAVVAVILVNTSSSKRITLDEWDWERIAQTCKVEERLDPSQLPFEAKSGFEMILRNLKNIEPTSLEIDDCSARSQAILSMAILLESSALTPTNTTTDLESLFALSVLFFSTDGLNWRRRNGWLNDTNVCLWNSIECSSENQVIGVDLDNTALLGTLPEELTSLVHLRNLNLPNNVIRGPLFDVSKLTNLERIELFDNEISGTIPTGIGALSNLLVFDIARNPVEGTIPNSMGTGCTSLELINLFGTAISGTIPTELGELSRLEILDLGRLRRVSGTIPTELSNLSFLMVFTLQTPSFDGSIPLGLWKLPMLEELTISSDGALDGLIPEGTFSEKLNWRAIDISHNRFRGTIPSEIGLQTDLAILRALSNQLTGSIPTEIGNCSSLTEFSVDANLFIRGPLPSEIGQLKNLVDLYLDRSGVTGTIPTEIGLATSLNAVRFGFLMEGPAPMALCSLREFNLEHIKSGCNSPLQDQFPAECGRTTCYVDDVYGFEE